ncbi:tail protein X [uncultured Megasphaera sp.]|uniref:tail protein X n=1 Tax=uncultured Megasphaera sp. TaxID=165188 RepID=UPI0025957010|nr:tail protein X [uncultured Megasphaera sp.]
MSKRVYKTIQGDTWDGIAVKVYGDEKYMNELLEANQMYMETIIFPANVSISLPDIQAQTTTILPPWKKV